MTSIQKARQAVKSALILSILKSIAFSTVVVVLVLAVFYIFNPTAFLIPLLLDGQYLAVFIKLVHYVAGLTVIDLLLKVGDISESISLLYQSRNK